MPGWYPDPAGAPGRFRHWNGTSWSAETTTSPTSAPPGGPTPDPPPVPRRRGGRWIAAGALLVVLIVVGAFVIRGILLDQNTIVDSAPYPSGSGWDDSSPTDTPTPPATSSPTPSPTPTPSESAGPPLVDCPTADPSARTSHPQDLRVHGGGLSFPAQSGWDSTGLDLGLSWAYDVGAQDKRVQARWFAMYAVGALLTADGFEAPRQSADAVMQCTASSNYYDGFTGRTDLSSRAVTIDGRPGWALRSEIHVDTDATTFAGDVVEVIVVDTDAPESLAMFWGCAPIGDTALIAQLDQVISQLQVD